MNEVGLVIAAEEIYLMNGNKVNCVCLEISVIGLQSFHF